MAFNLRASLENILFISSKRAVDVHIDAVQVSQRRHRNSLAAWKQRSKFGPPNHAYLFCAGLPLNRLGVSQEPAIRSLEHVLQS